MLRRGALPWAFKLACAGGIALVLLGMTLAPIVMAQETTVTHTVRAGENLYLIAARYNVTVRAIMRANNLRNPNVIYVGQRLVIPISAAATPVATVTATAAPGVEEEQVHVVARGETLFAIALRYGASVGELMRANNLRNANLIRPGQRLVIPAVPAASALPPETPAAPTPRATEMATPTVAPTPTAAVAAATPTASPATPTPIPPTPAPTLAAPETVMMEPVAALQPISGEVIAIMAPAPNQTIVSPAVVTGLASAFEQQITVRILDEAGNEVGLGVGFIDADMGQRGPFTATVPFAVPTNTQFGRIQVYSVSPRDGAVEHLNSVVVRLQGLDLDPIIDLLKEAIEQKQYADLRSFMPPDAFAIGLYRSEGQVLSPDAALQQIKENYLGPGNVKVDLSVDARALLADRVILPADVRWVGFSTGWGASGQDDAFLLIMERNGRAYWGGLLYVPASVIDYR